MTQMYSVRIIAEGQQFDANNDGNIEDCPVGTIISGPDAWRLCGTFFRNTIIAEPADEVTAAKVAEWKKERQPAKDAARMELQNQVNAYALNKKLGLQFEADGKPRRKDGEIVGNLTNLQRHRLETALAYGIVPTNVTVAPAAVAPVKTEKPVKPAAE
jgi:hypothetical protein